MPEGKRLYYFTSAKYALLNIEQSHIKISDLNRVNDPYEFLAVKLNQRSRHNLLTKVISHLGKQFGIVCFSKCYNNPLSWGHYSDACKGICLGFDISYDSNKDFD